MDKLKSMGGDAMGLKGQRKDVTFPACKDEVCSQLEQKGVPSRVVDKARNPDTIQFGLGSVDDVMSTNP